MTAEGLAARIQAGEDVKDSMTALYEQVRPFLHMIAWQYRGVGELEDLEQEAFLALYPAVEKYDPAAGVRFLTYAEHWIRQRIRRYIQTEGGDALRLPFHLQEKAAKYKHTVESFRKEYGHEPSDAFLCHSMDVSPDQLEDIKKAINAGRTASLESPIKGFDDGETLTVGDAVPDPKDLEEEITSRVDEEELKRLLWSIVEELPGEQAEVVKRKYKAGQTAPEIASLTGQTVQKVRLTERHALAELRKPARSFPLWPFLSETNELIRNRAIRGGSVARFRQTWTSSTEREALHRCRVSTSGQ